MQLDLIIRGGTVHDGSGGPGVRADVGIRDDEIAVVDDLSNVEDVESIDAAGHCVAPGFIDIHTHSDISILNYPDAQSRVRQGITTEVVGNCSYSPFPVTEAVRKFISPRLSDQNVDQPWPWQDVAGYREFLEQQGIGLNIAPLVGHGSVRVAAMGMANRPPNDNELSHMRNLAAEAIDQGAFGFSTGLTLVPSSYSATDEIIEICKPVAEKGGFYATHSRLWADHHFRAAEEAIEIGRAATIPVQISHQTIVDPRYYGRAAHIVDMIQQARDDDIDVLFDMYPYRAGGTQLDQLLPDWSVEGGTPALLSRLRDPVQRRRVSRETARGWFRGIPWQWDQVQLSRVSFPEYSRFVGQTIGAVAEDLGRDPLDTMLHLIDVCENDVRCVMFNRDEQDVRYFMSHPLGMIGSDGSSISPRGVALRSQPHPRFYGCYPRILGRYCREEQVLPLELAIHKMTAAPAARLGLKNRGRLTAGYKADVVVFNPDTVIDRATFDDPHQYPDGIEHVLINGQAVVTPAGHTGHLPGRVLARGS